MAIQSMSTTKNSKLELLGGKEFQSTFKTKTIFPERKMYQEENAYFH